MGGGQANARARGGDESVFRRIKLIASCSFPGLAELAEMSGLYNSEKCSGL